MSLHVTNYFSKQLANSSSDWIKLSCGEEIIAYPSYCRRNLENTLRGYDKYSQKELCYSRCAPTTIQKVINCVIYFFNKLPFLSMPYLSTKEEITFVLFSYQVPFEENSRPIFSHVKEKISKTIYKNTM